MKPTLYWILSLVCVSTLTVGRATERSLSPLAGTWHVNAVRSAELSPWRDYDLTITVEGTKISIARELGWGRRHFSDRMVLDSTQKTNEVPIELWPDNRNLGATIGSSHTKKVSVTWLDDGRILRLSTDLVLETQQGSRSVNILSDYKVSANGDYLTLTELRSTRNRPVIYVFNRAGSPADVAASKTP